MSPQLIVNNCIHIQTTGATDIEYFKIEGVNFIAIANYYDHERKSNKVTSTVYRYQGRNKLFKRVQDVPTFGYVLSYNKRLLLYIIIIFLNIVCINFLSI